MTLPLWILGGALSPETGVAQAQQGGLLDASLCRVVGPERTLLPIREESLDARAVDANFRSLLEIIGRTGTRSRVRYVDADYLWDTSDDVVLASAAAGDIYIDLLGAKTLEGRMLWVKKVDDSSNAVIARAQGGDLIEGFSELSLTGTWEQAILVSTSSAFVNFAR